MPLTLPKSILFLPKVPGVLVIGLIATQIIFFVHGNDTEPICTLKVDRRHYSTSLSENKDFDAIKLNITSSCNVPQKYTELTASIQKIKNDRQVSAFKFERTRRLPTKKTPNITNFKDLFVPCTKGVAVAYSGEAKGYVFLENGKKYRVEGTSGKFIAVACLVGAQ